MNPVEIRKAIDFENELMKEALTPNFFTLNNTVKEILKEIDRLQNLCSHQYEDGFCIYCDKEKGDE